MDPIIKKIIRYDDITLDELLPLIKLFEHHLFFNFISNAEGFLLYKRGITYKNKTYTQTREVDLYLDQIMDYEWKLDDTYNIDVIDIFNVVYNYWDAKDSLNYKNYQYYFSNDKNMIIIDNYLDEQNPIAELSKLEDTQCTII